MSLIAIPCVKGEKEFGSKMTKFKYLRNSLEIKEKPFWTLDRRQYPKDK